MSNFHYVNGKCDELLANDIRNQLQTEIVIRAEKNSKGVYGDLKDWKHGKWSSKCWYKPSIVTIGNDDYKVLALRSYDTIVGFICRDYMYEIGHYSLTTTRQFTKYFIPHLSDKFAWKISYEKLS